MTIYAPLRPYIALNSFLNFRLRQSRQDGPGRNARPPRPFPQIGTRSRGDFPLILNSAEGCRSVRSRGIQGVFTLFIAVPDNQTLYYVIPSVAEESKSLEMESKPGILDSSATLGMTSFNGVQDERKGRAIG